MTTYQWENILVKYFTTVKQIDSECEQIRQDLCIKSSFIPRQLFNALDTDAKNFISLNDFINFLSSKYVQYDEESLRRFIHNFDKDNDFSIDYNEFINIVLPRTNISLRSDAEQRELREGEEEKAIEVSIESSFIQLLKTELSLVKELAGIAEELKTSKDFTTYEAFLAIAHDSKYITEANMEMFLRDKNVQLRDNDVGTLLFRIDSDADGKISYDEFQEIFFPFKLFTSSTYSAKGNSLRQSQQQERCRSIDRAQNDDVIDKNKSIDMNLKGSGYEIGCSQNLKDDIPNERTRNTYCHTMDDNSNDIISQSRMICRGMKSSPRAQSPLQSKDMSYQPRENTYNSPLRTSVQSSNQRDFSPMNFNRSPLRNSMRTEAKVAPMERLQSQPNEIRPMEISSSSCRCTPCGHVATCCSCCNCCQCCCIEAQKIQNLYNLLNDLIVQDSKIEEIKEQLAFCSDVNLRDMFAVFDVAHRNSISPLDLCEALRTLGLSFNISDAKTLYKAYDKNLDGRFDYAEFINMILPKKFEIAKLINDRLPPNYFLGFSYNTNRLIANLFGALLEAEKSNEEYRGILSSTPNSSVFESFNKLKKSYCSGIYKEDLVCFMEDNGSRMTQFETELIMERLDKNQDGVISYNEFIYEIAPKF